MLTFIIVFTIHLFVYYYFYNSFICIVILFDSPNIIFDPIVSIKLKKAKSTSLTSHQIIITRYSPKKFKSKLLTDKGH